MSKDKVVENGRERSSSMAEELTGHGWMDQREFSSVWLKGAATKAATNPNISECAQVDKCEACGRELAVDETFTEHLVCVHLTAEGLCDICGGDSEDFIQHFKMHLKSFQLQALSLPSMVSIKAEVVDKVDLDDNENCIYDMNEGISVTTKNRVDQNLKMEVETDKHVATKIEEEEEFQKLVKFVSENSLLCNEQENSQFKCNMCNGKFKQVSQHVALYHCNITYPCSLCDKFIGHRKEMKKHVANEHGEQTNSGRAGYCSKCNKTVSRISAHTRRVHLKIKQYFCTVCEKGFYDKRDFEKHKHMSDSHGHKREVCEECGLSVMRLQSHIKNIHTNKPSQICEECGKSVGNVRDHMKSVHEKVRNFSCPMCPLKTYKKGTLDRHLAVHEKYIASNKPYPYNPRKHESNLENLWKATELVISVNPKPPCLRATSVKEEATTDPLELFDVGT